MNTLFLLILALVPCFILLFFILFMDRNEKEPLGLVIRLIILGALSVFLSALIEDVLESQGVPFDGKIPTAIYTSFLYVAWIEELCKLGVVLLLAWRHKDFNEENDGIVYAGSSALGFAMLENVFYVLSLGVNAGLARAITAVPLHCFCGVLMGSYVGRAKFSPIKKARKWLIIKGFFLAVLIHGVYDALLFTQTPIALLNIPMIAGLIILGFKALKKGRFLSQRHGSSETSAPIVPQSIPPQKKWKMILSRTLLTLSMIFWIVMIIGLLDRERLGFPEGVNFSSHVIDLVVGGVIVSFLPILIGVMLEISYQNQLKIFRSLQPVRPQPEVRLSPVRIPSVDPAPLLTLHAAVWKIVVSRLIFGICAFSWLGLLIGNECRGHALIGITVLTFFPVLTGILLERSYHKSNKNSKKKQAKSDDWLLPRQNEQIFCNRGN
ncbi:MAG: PrsW family intramembrane metalloprotease [Candidatus Omnitrophota bacterium]